MSTVFGTDNRFRARIKSSVFLTEKGPIRALNADHILADDHLGIYLVADGVGAAEGSAEASRFTVKATHRLLKSALITAPEANPDLAAVILSVWPRFLDHFAGLTVPATTLTIVTIRQGWIHYASVGDSPIFLLIDGTAHLLTRDHTVADRGRVISSYSALKTMNGSSILFSSIGRYAPQPVTYAPIECVPGSRLLMCSDGLLEIISQEGLGTLSQSCSTLTSFRRALMKRGASSSARDNYSCVVIDLDGKEPMR